MPYYCCVPGCKSKDGGHRFPKSKEDCLRWRVAIRRVDPASKKLWWPKQSSVVCKAHFTKADYLPSLMGERPRLKQSAVPSVFSFKGKDVSSSAAARVERQERKTARKRLLFDEFVNEVQVQTDDLVDNDHNLKLENERATESVGIQCEILNDKDTAFSINLFKTNPTAVQYYTGFKNYNHFCMFFSVLGPAVNHLKYQCTMLTPQDQLFLTLMKLRQGKDDAELSILFKISLVTVSKIFNTWINFLYFQLKEIRIWPGRDLIDEYMPLNFKKNFRNTRVILDATETPIEKPSDVNLQSATFSSYKHKNTLKTMIGITPRGVVSYISDSYGGSASDRQIIERSELCKNDNNMFNSKDSIMADKGILVQDLFCAKDVQVNTPTVLKGKSQLEPHEVIRDRRISSKRIHVERIIGLSKRFKILKRELIPSKLSIGSRIIFVCVMLSNFRKSIVGRLA